MTKHTQLGVSILAGLSLLAVFGLAITVAVAEPISVIELYTSQGCSSCPPADRLLDGLAKRPDVIALSFPVSYWDYLGWKDTLARPEYTERQRQYASIQSDGQVFTPEVIVNGVRSCVGSNLEEIESALRSTESALRKEAVPLTAHRENGRIVIDAGAAPEGSGHRRGVIWLASVRRAAPVSIGRGENAGRVVTYTNVVRSLTEAGEWEGSPASYAISMNMLPKDGDMFVVFLQTDKLGPIVGAARVQG